MTQFAESVVEEAALARLKALGYAVLHGPAIAMREVVVDETSNGGVARGVRFIA